MTGVYIALAVLAVWNAILTVKTSDATLVAPPTVHGTLKSIEATYDAGLARDNAHLKNENIRLRGVVEHKCKGCALDHMLPEWARTRPSNPSPDIVKRHEGEIQGIIAYLNIEKYEERGYRKKEDSK